MKKVEAESHGAVYIQYFQKITEQTAEKLPKTKMKIKGYTNTQENL